MKPSLTGLRSQASRPATHDNSGWRGLALATAVVQQRSSKVGLSAATRRIAEVWRSVSQSHQTCLSPWSLFSCQEAHRELFSNPLILKAKKLRPVCTLFLRICHTCLRSKNATARISSGFGPLHFSRRGYQWLLRLLSITLVPSSLFLFIPASETLRRLHSSEMRIA